MPRNQSEKGAQLIAEKWFKPFTWETTTVVRIYWLPWNQKHRVASKRSSSRDRWCFCDLDTYDEAARLFDEHMDGLSWSRLSRSFAGWVTSPI